MDKQLILAVAGSGKTTLLIDNLNLEERFLIITYTKNNFSNLRRGIVRKFGYFPENIHLFSYFAFLYGFCFKPLLHTRYKTKGINFDFKPVRYKSKEEIGYFIDDYSRLFHSRIALLLIEKGAIDELRDRIGKYFSVVFIDEIQDFAGHDFNLLKVLATVNGTLKFVGDFYQHTFDTSRDGNVNSGLYDDYSDYIKRFKKMDITIDDKTLSKSYRCSPTICDFITKNLQIDINSHKEMDSEIHHITTIEQAKIIFQNQDIIKLFYNNHHLYDCYSRNWGDCKGENHYFDVCVVLNRNTFKLFCKSELYKLAPTTKKKLYVAISRANNNLYLVSDELIKQFSSLKSEA